jgi:hypothetical protein
MKIPVRDGFRLGYAPVEGEGQQKTEKILLGSVKMVTPFK